MTDRETLKFMIPYKILRLFLKYGTYNLGVNNDDEILSTHIVIFLSFSKNCLRLVASFRSKNVTLSLPFDPIDRGQIWNFLHNAFVLQNFVKIFMFLRFH
jgi:hypothetical protein